MAVPTIAIVLVIVLAIIVGILHKNSIVRYNANLSSITKLSSEMNKKHANIAKTIDAKGKETKSELESLQSDILMQAKRIESTEKDIFNRIKTLKEESDISISEAKKQASRDAEAAYVNATQHTDLKADGVIQYVNELRNNLAKQFDDRIETITSILDSLNKENAQLRIELDEQKKKLNFYANIEEAAENLTIKEDTDERTRALETVRQKIMSEQNVPRTSNADKNKNGIDDSCSGLQKGSPPSLSESVSANTKLISSYKKIEEQYPKERHLDQEQEFARKYMDNTTENVFITGKAGTGKSFLLDIFRLTTSKSNIVLAPTGIAALNVKGATLHSTFGYYNLVNLDVDDICEDKIRLKSEKRHVLKRVKTIIIDEISMVRADTFDKIDRILKAINRSDLPFGGKQMLIFGDLFQLPPVTRGQQYEYLFDKYGGIYFFHADSYKAGDFKFIELTENHRQKGDEVFFEILNRIREGDATDADIELLNTRYTPNESIYDRYTSLFPTKAEAEQVNKSHLEQIESAEVVFRAKTILDKNPNKNKSIESVFPISEELRLKLGAYVMMVANDPEGRWVNGTVGIVIELSEDGIIVSFGKGRNYEVQPLEFDEQEISYDGRKITYEKVFSVMQYPIALAYAITIHKSQGQTYENVMCDIERCFTSGQAYVALSRCASLNGLHLKSFVTPASIKVDHDVLEFYRNQLANSLRQ